MNEQGDATTVEQPREAETGLSTADLAAAGSTPQRAAPSSDTQVETRSSGGDQASSPLFSSDKADDYRTRWSDVQASFVDDPRRAVEQADGLVADVIKRLAEIFADERRKLESQWEQGEDVSTEDLRVGLQRYRAFFDRLLSV